MEREIEKASVFRYIQASKIIEFYSCHSEEKALRGANTQNGKGGTISPAEFTDSSSDNNWEEFLVPLSDWDRIYRFFFG